jgi:hypothetical protein
MKKMKFVYLNPLAWFLLVWGISLLWIESISLIYGHEFLNQALFEEYIMIKDYDYFKVLSYSKDEARIYYISGDKTIGSIVTYKKENGEWSYKKWDVVWSISGTADSVIWPYWLHFFYSHPRL